MTTTWLDAMEKCNLFLAPIPTDQWFRDARCQLQYEEAKRLGLPVVFLIRRGISLPEKYKPDLVQWWTDPEDYLTKDFCDQIEKLIGREVKYFMGGHRRGV